MNAKEILNEAKYIQFPLINGTFQKFPNEYDIIQLPLTKNDQYRTYPYNDHHIKTLVLFNKVMPALNDILNFNFNPDDYIMETQMDGKYDISMPIPKNDFIYDCKSLYRDSDYFTDISYRDLMVLSSKQPKLTKWHYLYKFAHECSTVDNKTNKNGRRILIIGDSQMIPLVTMMSIYFEHITYIDNREKMPILNKIIDIDYTDCIVNLFMTNIRTLQNYII